jgi:hypothetical protein
VPLAPVRAVFEETAAKSGDLLAKLDRIDRQSHHSLVGQAFLNFEIKRINQQVVAGSTLKRTEIFRRTQTFLVQLGFVFK